MLHNTTTYAELLFVKKDDFKPNFDTTYSRHVYKQHYLLPVGEKILATDFRLSLHTEPDLLSKAKYLIIDSVLMKQMSKIRR